MTDKILRVVTGDAQFRVVIIWMPETAKTLLNQHQPSNEMGLHLVNLAMSSLLLGAGLKGQGAASLRVESSGLIGIMQADGTPDGLVRALISKANIEDEELGKKLELPMIGSGSFSVTKTYNDSRKQYTGVIEMVSTSVAHNTAAYLLTSEQIKSSVGTSTLFKDGELNKAAAFLVEAMPGVKEEDLKKIEENIKSFGDLDQLLENSENPENILEKILKGFDIQILKEIPVQFFCPCTEEKVINAIKASGEKEIMSIIEEGVNLEIFCDYCRKRYDISPASLKN